MRLHAKLVVVVLAALLAVACGPVDPTDSSAEELGVGVYVSKATNLGNAGYIGDWEHDWGYVLGYLAPGARIYAKTVRADSVYGLITNSHYGAWDHGHHCGWVSLKHLKGQRLSLERRRHLPAARQRLQPRARIGRTHRFPKGELDRMRRVRAARGRAPDVLRLHRLRELRSGHAHVPRRRRHEVAGRGTVYGNYRLRRSQVTATQGYSGFGTRFVTTDGDAVEIKDTKRTCNLHGGCTAFGFMHADCIGGAQVGNPAGKLPTTKLPDAPSAPCGEVLPGEGMRVGQTFGSCGGRFMLTLQSDGNLVLRDEQQNARAIWATNTSNTDGYVAIFQTDGNLVLYGHYQNALWSSHTSGKGGVRLEFQGDGNVVLYDGSAKAVWSTDTAGQ